MFSISAVKSVVQIVRNLEESSLIYESGLDLERVHSETVNDKHTATFARPGDDFGMIRLVEDPNALSPIRDVSRPNDFGIMTLNFRTNDIDRAVERLRQVGCEPISAILDYNVGKPMREVMFATPTGERLTIIEVGGKAEGLAVYTEALATVGLVIPSMSASLNFYENGLGLNKAIAFQASGAPFDSLLGVKRLDKLDFATLNSGTNWTGKVELLELETDSQPMPTDARPNRTGYRLVTFETNDLDSAARRCLETGAEIVDETSLSIVFRAPGGELIEIAAA